MFQERLQIQQSANMKKEMQKILGDIVIIEGIIGIKLLFYVNCTKCSNRHFDKVKKGNFSGGTKNFLFITICYFQSCYLVMTEVLLHEK